MTKNDRLRDLAAYLISKTDPFRVRHLVLILTQGSAAR